MEENDDEVEVVKTGTEKENRVLLVYLIGISFKCFSDLVTERCYNLGWDV